MDFLGDSKVRDDDGNLTVLYRGDYRGDVLSAGFKIIESDDSGSGGLYFTDNAEVASNYSITKPFYEENACDAWRYIEVARKGKTKRVPFSKIEFLLSASEKSILTQKVLSISEGQNGYACDGSDPVIGADTWKEFLRRSRDRYIPALVDVLLDSALMDKDQFLIFLNDTGLFDHVVYADPFEPLSVVTPVYLDVKNPIDTSQYPSDFFDKMEAIVGVNDETLSYLKEARDGTLGVETVTFITKDFREAMLSLGYDGIKDTGGIITDGDLHNVWIALAPEQVTPAYSHVAVDYRRSVEHDASQAMCMAY